MSKTRHIPIESGKTLPEGISIRGDMLLVTPINKVKRPIKSVSTPSAQSTRPCDRVSDGSVKLSSLVDSLLENLSYDYRLQLVCRLILEFGVRVTEALRVKGTDISPSGSVFVRGLKGSSDRYFHIGKNSIAVKRLAGKAYSFKDDYNRYQLYRLFKKAGLSVRYNSNTNCSVTHVGRHIVGSEAYKMNNDINDVAVALGHKSTKSSEYYTDDGTKK